MMIGPVAKKNRPNETDHATRRRNALVRRHYIEIVKVVDTTNTEDREKGKYELKGTYGQCNTGRIGEGRTYPKR